MNKSESIKELAKALNLAQAEMKGAIKDATNPFFKSKYADLESIWEAVKGPLLKHGLCVSQLTGQTTNGDPVVETLLMHTSGEWLMGQFPMVMKDVTPQSMGSAVSYARRYALAALCSLPQIDDDGEAAMTRDHSVIKEHKPVVSSNGNYNARGDRYISEKQAARFYAIAYKHGKNAIEANKWLNLMFKFNDASQILSNQYDQIINRIEGTATIQGEPPPIIDQDLPF